MLPFKMRYALFEPCCGVGRHIKTISSLYNQHHLLEIFPDNLASAQKKANKVIAMKKKPLDYSATYQQGAVQDVEHYRQHLI